MPKKPRRPRDVNELARLIADQATGATPVDQAALADGKNPAAVALGRLGGLKGGRARAEKLTVARRKAIASKAAKSRWHKD